MSDTPPLRPARKKPSSMSPTKRALAECRKRGWPAAIVEHWNQWARIRQDLFGVFDLLVIRPEFWGTAGVTVDGAPLDMELPHKYRAAIIGIQVTSATNRAARRDKLQAWPLLRQWCETGAEVELWTWAKQGARGKRKLWTLTVERIVPTKA